MDKQAQNLADSKATIPELIQRLVNLAYMPHFQFEEDNWYSCPKSGKCSKDKKDKNICNCGADEHNEKVEDLAIALGIAISKRG